MKEIRKIYEKILDSKEFINDIYSTFITTRITHNFVEIVYFIFLTIVQFQFKKHGLPNGILEFVLKIYPLILICKFVILAGSGELLSRQGKKTTVVVHRLISKISDYPTQYEVITKETSL